MICPVDDFTCPYFDKEIWGCRMAIDGEGDPREECDAWYDED